MEQVDGIVEGYRLWKIIKGKKGDWVLSSIAAKNIVSPRRVNKAFHYEKTRELTKEACPCVHGRCGFNILRYNEELNEDIQYLPGYVIGRAYGWGKIIPGEKGFRCQYFYPKSIFGVVGYDKLIPINEELEKGIYLPRSGNIITLTWSMSTYAKDRVECYPAIEVLWKIARLYKIKLETELPNWKNINWEKYL